MRDAERLLAAVENERHDQVLFVVEMADEASEQSAARRRVGVAATLQRLRLVGKGAQQRVCSSAMSAWMAWWSPYSTSKPRANRASAARKIGK